MQTFLPYPCFVQSAQCLDNKRLGKQRVEVPQLLNVITKGGGWSNHPAARMWRGYKPALLAYGLAICSEWTARGYKDTCAGKLISLGLDYPAGGYPPWLGDNMFHASHRSNLLRKDPIWYGKFGWTEGPDLPYVWPVRKELK